MAKALLQKKKKTDITLAVMCVREEDIIRGFQSFPMAIKGKRFYRWTINYLLLKCPIDHACVQPRGIPRLPIDLSTTAKPNRLSSLRLTRNRRIPCSIPKALALALFWKVAATVVVGFTGLLGLF